MTSSGLAFGLYLLWSLHGFEHFFSDCLEPFFCLVLRLLSGRPFLGGSRWCCLCWVCLWRGWWLDGLFFRRDCRCGSDLAYLQVDLEHLFMEALEEVFFGRLQVVQVNRLFVSVYFSVYSLQVSLVSLQQLIFFWFVDQSLSFRLVDFC